ncbi:exostosin-2-like [Actinia tenebrosa]|uniref:Exostosin-2 n=1 Tax=Actinia tenebrosa TaxID=6105 RepID=A0A6P8I176_ACTTE|nr:exostosin-2-like [Actinia tenebrosa]
MKVDGSMHGYTKKYRKSDKPFFTRNVFLPRMRLKTRTVFLVAVLFAAFLVFVSSQIWTRYRSEDDGFSTDRHHSGSKNVIRVLNNSASPLKTDLKCRMFSCFDIYRCKFNENSLISVYVYPFNDYVDGKGNRIHMKPVSQQLYELLTAIKRSSYYTSDRKSACIVVPSIDLLNQNRMDLTSVQNMLLSLPSWTQSGQNHLIFNMLPGGHPDYNTSLDLPLGKAIQAGGGLSTWTYRPEYDISIPVYNVLTNKQVALAQNRQTRWLAISSQVNYSPEYRKELNELAKSSQDYLILEQCADPKNDNPLKRCKDGTVYSYPDVLQSATFCMVIRGLRLGQSTLMDSLMMGCIPIVISDNYVLPFSEVLDWKRAAIVVPEDDIQTIPNLLKDISSKEIADMRRQGQFLWNNYFSSMSKIGLTTLKIINDRVYKHRAWMYEDWNAPFSTSDGKITNTVLPPLFLPLIPPHSQGFTAVVLSYDRVDMMFKVLKKISDTPSLVKIVVVWNNVNKAPPSVAKWPKLSKPVKVVQTKRNRLSNRFYPYSEIETEAILAIDDDILMLSNDELQFGYEAWREFPDRLVGFPGRFHVLENGTNLKYDSEWTNDVSMVLTGAAFHHKYFSHVFTYMMPYHIRSWVDNHMNCEDIAMNFMVANYTGKAPIKVTSRKRFRCYNCTSDSLWANPKHFVERSACLNEFVKAYGGHSPLKSVEFRADPILFRENVPDRIKKYRNIGTV